VGAQPRFDHERAGRARESHRQGGRQQGGARRPGGEEYDQRYVVVSSEETNDDETDEGLKNFSDDDDDALCLLPRYDANRWAEFGVRRGARDSREVLPKEVSQIERDGTKEDDARLFAWAEAFVKSKKKLLDEEQLPFHKRDRGVVAMLVSRDGALLDCAVNTNNSNTALHAEVNLLAPWLEGFLEEETEDGDDATDDDRRVKKDVSSRKKKREASRRRARAGHAAVLPHVRGADLRGVGRRTYAGWRRDAAGRRVRRGGRGQVLERNRAPESRMGTRFFARRGGECRNVVTVNFFFRDERVVSPAAKRKPTTL
jgi:hypothetical protein